MSVIRYMAMSLITRRSLNLAWTVMLTALACGAQASPTVNFTVSSVYPQSPYTTVDISLNGGTSWSQDIVATINLTKNTGGTFTGALLGASPTVATSFCIQPTEGIGFSSYTGVNLVALAVAGSANSGGMGANAAQLLNALFGTYHPDFTAPLTDKLKIGALQIATWEIVSESLGAYSLNVSTGNARFKNDSLSGMVSLAQSYLDAISGAAPLPAPKYALMGLGKAGVQDLLVQVASAPDVAVPEPGTWALLTLGFGLLTRSTRHRNPSESC